MWLLFYHILTMLVPTTLAEGKEEHHGTEESDLLMYYPHAQKMCFEYLKP